MDNSNYEEKYEIKFYRSLRNLKFQTGSKKIFHLTSWHKSPFLFSNGNKFLRQFAIIVI